VDGANLKSSLTTKTPANPSGCVIAGRNEILKVDFAEMNYVSKFIGVNLFVLSAEDRATYFLIEYQVKILHQGLAATKSYSLPVDEYIDGIVDHVSETIAISTSYRRLNLVKKFKCSWPIGTFLTEDWPTDADQQNRYGRASNEM
jgi:hypothetical protein